MRTEEEAQINDDEEEFEIISKSQQKRESQALQDLGKKLSHLNADQLAKIPMDDKLREAIALSHRLVNKRSALKRHYQYIGKILRNVDAEPILEAVEAIENRDRHNKQHFKELEYWRGRILDEGDPAINECCTQHPELERQQLRQLWRNHKSAKDEKKHHIARQLFRELQASITD